jgi:hypothetical protein
MGPLPWSLNRRRQYNELYGIATTKQETVLPTRKRTDITLKGKHVLVILELKKLNGNSPPTAADKKIDHKQLGGYVQERITMEEKNVL